VPIGSAQTIADGRNTSWLRPGSQETLDFSWQRPRVNSKGKPTMAEFAETQRPCEHEPHDRDRDDAPFAFSLARRQIVVGGLVLVGGLVGVLTAAVAFYTSAADVISGMAGRAVLPVGKPMWTESRRRG